MCRCSDLQLERPARDPRTDVVYGCVPLVGRELWLKGCSLAVATADREAEDDDVVETVVLHQQWCRENDPTRGVAQGSEDGKCEVR